MNLLDIIVLNSSKGKITMIFRDNPQGYQAFYAHRNRETNEIAVFGGMVPCVTYEGALFHVFEKELSIEYLDNISGDTILEPVDLIDLAEGFKNGDRVLANNNSIGIVETANKVETMVSFGGLRTNMYHRNEIKPDISSEYTLTKDEAEKKFNIRIID